MNRLLFIYIDKYQESAPIELNFSNDFHIAYKNDGTLNVQIKQNLIEGLYGTNISDINIIAGQNGIGKTTLLKLIAEIVKEKDRYSDSYDYHYVKVIQTGKSKITVFECLKENEFTVVNAPDIDYEYYNDPTYEQGRSLVYYSPHLDFNVLELSSNIETQPIIDLSSTNILMDDMDESKDDYEDGESFLPSPLLQHKVRNFKRQLIFVKENQDRFGLPFTVPRKFWLNFHRPHPEKDDLSQQDYKLFNQFQSLFAKFFREYPENKLPKKMMARMMFLRNLICVYFKSINSIKTSSILTHSFTTYDISAVEEFSSKNPEDLLNLTLLFFEQQDLFNKGAFLRLINVVFEAIADAKIRFENANNLLSLELDLSDMHFNNVISAINGFSKGNKVTPIMPGISAFISFDWSNVSSGQKMFLDLFSRLYGIKDKLQPAIGPILMIIDEGEMGFHPEWQIKYVETIKLFFNTHFEDVEFQILLATHSPLVLSDFPKERVHLLAQYKKSGKRHKIESFGTFAQNTGELLANDFFITTTLIGNLAKSFINDILAEIVELKNLKVKITKAKLIDSKIEMIDEPVIRQLLESELERARNA